MTLYKPQRLSLRGVDPSGSKRWSPLMGEDIVCPLRKLKAVDSFNGHSLTTYVEHQEKRLPFRNKFNSFVITDPYEVHDGFDHGTDNPDIDGIVVDSLTFLMDMFNNKYIYNAVDGRAAWGDYQQFFRTMLQDKVPTFAKPVIFMAHVRDDFDAATETYKTTVPIQGALKNVSVEAYFSTIVSAKTLTLKQLEPYQNDMLTITPDDEMLGYKHVFQTRLTKNTTNERIRSPIGFFEISETFIDNDVQMLLNHLNKCYS